VWERAWERFVPFLEFEPAIRKVIYTTNTIESFNRKYSEVVWRGLGGPMALR